MKKLKDVRRLLKPRLVLMFAGLIILIGLLSVQYESWRTVTFVIPPGVGAGEATVFIPAEIVLTVGISDLSRF